MSSSPSPTCEFSSPSPPASIIEVRCHESRCHCIKRDKITTSMPDEYFSEYFLSGWHSRVSCRLLLMTQTITALGSFRQSCLMPSNRDLSAYSSDKSDFNFFFLTSVETKCHVCPSIYRQKGKLRARRHKDQTWNSSAFSPSPCPLSGFHHITLSQCDPYSRLYICCLRHIVF